MQMMGKCQWDRTKAWHHNEVCADCPITALYIYILCNNVMLYIHIFILIDVIISPWDLLKSNCIIMMIYDIYMYIHLYGESNCRNGLAVVKAVCYPCVPTLL